ncbi:MAG: SDR family oxidoreductase [Gammaproteobacteria bacterium]|nr:SDR family oxidoreductase [Gammaproteobacteria bacterium]
MITITATLYRLVSAGMRAAILASALATITLAAPAAAEAQKNAPTILITGASTGHGLAFTEEYARLGWHVIATCRTPAKADRLNALAGKFPNVAVEQLDIVDDTQISALAEKYRGKAIDVLMNNAAINTFRFGARNFAKIDYKWFEEVLVVNVIGPMKVSEAFQEHVAASRQKKIIAMTSTGGSIAEVTVPIAIPYRASKAGLNMAMRSYSIALKAKGIIVSIIAPGTVDTEDYMNAKDPSTVPANYQTMIKGNLLAPRTAINDMIKLIDRLTLEDSGVFYEWTGRVIPW